MADTNNFWADAYKGDGFAGIGAFLQGIGQSYQDIERLTKLISDHLTPQQKAQVQQVIDSATTRYISEDFAKSMAVQDAERRFDEIFREYREEALPEIYSAECRTGIYDSTTAQLLANDAYSRTVKKAAEVVQATIKDYARIEVERAQAAAQLFTLALQDHTDSTENMNESKTPKMSAFSKDAATLFALMGVLSIFSKRQYFADQKGSKTSSGTTAGGIVETIVDIFT